MGSSPAQDEDVPEFQIHGDSPDTTEIVDDSADEDVPIFRIEGDQAPEQTSGGALSGPGSNAGASPGSDSASPAPDFATGYVDWEFIPVIEVTNASGAVSKVDAQRTLRDDTASIADCFEPQSYPGDGTVTVDVHISYNGIPQGVNGMTDGVRPAQARCVLQRAWRYEFPRMAEDADEGARVEYRVRFVGQRLGAPDRKADQPLLLLERVSTDDEELREPIARSLTKHLSTAEECAAKTLEDHPTDFIVSEVNMKWRQSGERYIPSHIDLTVKNTTSSDLPSQELMSCYKETLAGWGLQIESEDRLPTELEASYFITVRPAGISRAR